jgi:hypothetical protein
MFGLINTLADDQDHDVDLKLFGNAEIEPYDGCRLALWQRNRDPDSDRYAYVFFAPFNDGEMLPASIEIGSDIQEFNKIDMDVAPSGRLERFQLYRSSTTKYSALLEILDQQSAGASQLINDARLTIYHAENFPFNIRVKGHMSCPGAASSPTALEDEEYQIGSIEGEEISLQSAEMFNSIDAIPRTMLNFIDQELSDCTPAETSQIGASYAVSDTMTLWEIPCALYAYQGSHVFATALDSNQNYFSFLSFPGVGDGSQTYPLMQTEVRPNAEIVSVNLGRDGSCGTYQRHQLRAVEGEAVEAFLIELRSRETCDGADIDPTNFPLRYLVQ